MYATDLLSQLGSITVLLFPLKLCDAIFFSGAGRMFYARLPCLHLLNASPARATCKIRDWHSWGLLGESRDRWSGREPTCYAPGTRVRGSRIKRRDAVRVH